MVETSLDLESVRPEGIEVLPRVLYSLQCTLGEDHYGRRAVDGCPRPTE